MKILKRTVGTLLATLFLSGPLFGASPLLCGLAAGVILFFTWE
jgi:hypothetical protein